MRKKPLSFSVSPLLRGVQLITVCLQPKDYVCGKTMVLHREEASLRIITYGTFDLFHLGHVRLLARARALGEMLIVGLSTDEFNAVKGKTCVMPFEQRRAMLEACRHVDLVIPETCWEQKKTDVVEQGVGTFVMGDDWTGKFDDLRGLCDVVYLPRTPDISTTELKRRIVEYRQLYLTSSEPDAPLRATA
jgi:glycerol-3-phosphate cytidylyltransferase